MTVEKVPLKIIYNSVNCKLVLKVKLICNHDLRVLKKRSLEYNAKIREALNKLLNNNKQLNKQLYA